MEQWRHSQVRHMKVAEHIQIKIINIGNGVDLS